MADPWSGSRTFAALLACVMAGAGAAQVRAWLTASFAAEDELFGHSTRDNTAYFRPLDLVDTVVIVATCIAAAIWAAPALFGLPEAASAPSADATLTARHNARLLMISLVGALVVGVGLLYTARNYYPAVGRLPTDSPKR